MNPVYIGNDILLYLLICVVKFIPIGGSTAPNAVENQKHSLHTNKTNFGEIKRKKKKKLNRNGNTLNWNEKV